jgi:hypothetical protein|uniref:hypothetical protein n=1 Tax=Coprococcus sp. TaxID=2049024 RepID=UPI003FEFC747
MKKVGIYAIVCIMSLLIFTKGMISYAADTVIVSAAYETIEQVNSNNYIIPVYILNNPGIMGFRVDLSYDSDKIQLDAISRGKITEKGNFNSNIQSAVGSEYVSVYWNSTENVIGDGTIMYLCATIVDSDITTLDMVITYSQEDTFNEKWEDVILECHSITFPLKEEKTDITSEEEYENTAIEQTEISEYIDSKAYVDGMVPDEVRNDETEKKYLEAAKKEGFSVEAISEIGEDKVKNSLARKMKEYGVSSIDDLETDQKEKFWNAVGNDLVQIEGVDKKTIEKIDVSKLAENITVTDEDISNADLNAKPIKNNIFKNKGFFAGIIVFLIALILFVVFLKRRRKVNE